jgi:hypothetical protein
VAILLEDRRELVELVGLGVEVREVRVALGLFVGDLGLMSARLKRWKASPSMKAAATFSRRKISSKMRLTEVVPAPDEPVIEMMGCAALTVGAP